MKEKILIAEDEIELSKAIKTILEYNDYDIVSVSNGEEVIEITKNDKFDLIIMDVLMPKINGIEATKTLRSMGVETPIILLTAKTLIDDKVEGLDAGANDYLTKPFNRKELLARIRALIRTNEEKKEKYDIGNIVFNKEESEISNEKAVFHLNNKECKIMELLIKNRERKVSADELNKKIWDEDIKDESAVQIYISYLQDKFSALDANIKINDKNGYVLESKYN